ncbi:MAG: hypothetical protein COS89_05070 [Deltaproteobacteria bacterium CG07_land_8_20_14_0_80_38_7]|nr:MAG: hypothetical protein COS89_05070 [Deltaproteobacteria bacterium CG07_land_8_20_14_0_80_38_7]
MVGSVELFGNRDYLHLLRKEIYTEKGFKKIPVKILNSDDSQILAFLQGYNACDGLKAGNQKTEFKSFTSNSSVLAAGLFYLIHKALNLRVTLHPEFRGDKVYYHLNINSDCKHGNKGEHLKKPLGQVKGVRKTDYVGWLFDLETESGTFSAGIGLSWIHNSPRRGETFVTRKITRAIASILSKKQDKLFLGNLEAKRDWSFAPECVEAMWLILNHDKAGDFVLGSGESHSVKEFVEKAFFYVGLDWKDYVKVDSKYYRPTEVENLIADASNAKKLLNWKPKIDFDDLIKIMIDADMESAGLKPIGEGLNVIERKFGKNKWWKGN